MSDIPEPREDSPDDDSFEQKQDTLDRLRGTGVGVEDPNIVGDTSATDVPPGTDPDEVDAPGN